MLFFPVLGNDFAVLGWIQLRDTNEKNMQEIGEDVKDEKVKEIK